MDANGDRAATRPSAVAYLCPASQETRARWAPRIARWAEAEGLTLLEVYADRDPAAPVERRAGLAALLARAVTKDATVIVSAADDLPGEEHWGEIQAVLKTAHVPYTILPEDFLR